MPEKDFPRVTIDGIELTADQVMVLRMGLQKVSAELDYEEHLGWRSNMSREYREMMSSATSGVRALLLRKE